MIGKCPNCNIILKEPPFNGRETSEVMLTLKYRDIVESNNKLVSIEKAGYCKLCNAKTKDLKEQKKILASQNI